MPYLTDVLRHLPALAPDDQDGITLLLPHQWAQAHPEQVLTGRVEESAVTIEHVAPPEEWPAQGNCRFEDGYLWNTERG